MVFRLDLFLSLYLVYQVQIPYTNLKSICVCFAVVLLGKLNLKSVKRNLWAKANANCVRARMQTQHRISHSIRISAVATITTNEIPLYAQTVVNLTSGSDHSHRCAIS